MTYFKDGWGGSHNFKVGGELLHRDRLVRLHAGRVRQHPRDDRQQRRAGDTVQSVCADRHARRQPRRRPERQPAQRRQGEHARLRSSPISGPIGRATLNLGLRYDHYDVFTPDQSAARLHVPDRRQHRGDVDSRDSTYVKWNSFVPRLGVTYDLLGDGKTVLKVNYGLYRLQPGRRRGGERAIRTRRPRASPTRGPTTRSGCAAASPATGRLPAGRGGRPDRERAGRHHHGRSQHEAAVRRTQATVYVERQLTEGVGARVGFVYLQRHEPDRHVPAVPSGVSAYTVPFTVVDKGPDNIRATRTTRTSTFYGIPNAAHRRQLHHDRPGRDEHAERRHLQDVRSVDQQAHEPQLLAERRLRLHVDARLPATAIPNTPNGPFDYDFTGVRASRSNGTYNAPSGIRISPVYRYQTGANYARTLSVSAPASCACTFSAARARQRRTNTTRRIATPYNANRQDNVSVFDVRVEKTVNLATSAKVRLFLDGFNLTNAYAAETINTRTGASVPAADRDSRTADRPHRRCGLSGRSL